MKIIVANQYMKDQLLNESSYINNFSVEAYEQVPGKNPSKPEIELKNSL